MKLRYALLAATVLALPAAAGAQTLPAFTGSQVVSGLYLGAGAGANWINSPERLNLSGPGGLVPLPPNVTVSNAGKANFHTGWTGLLSIGWGFGNGLRAEIEGDYRSNEVNSIRGLGLAPIGRTGGFQQTYGLMANVFYDFDLAQFGLARYSVVQPYIGAGAGYARSDWRNLRGVSAVNGLRFNGTGSDGQFAYQAIAGLAFPFTWVGVPGLSFTAEYRFFGMLEPEMKGTITNASNVVVRSGKIEAEKYYHSVLLGLRYAFYQPPPPPPPVAAAPVAPPPSVARTYLVFFDWDRADLTARAREIIAEAARNARQVQSTRIEVAGHADRSGSAQYNQRLSQRRADAVAAELVRDGVNRSEIVVTAFGESRPLVPTADGVREPQNRRVEIVLR